MSLMSANQAYRKVISSDEITKEIKNQKSIVADEIDKAVKNNWFSATVGTKLLPVVVDELEDIGYIVKFELVGEFETEPLTTISFHHATNKRYNGSSVVHREM